MRTVEDPHILEQRCAGIRWLICADGRRILDGKHSTELKLEATLPLLAG